MRFELNILAHVVYNKYIFFHGATIEDYEKMTYWGAEYGLYNKRFAKSL